MENREIPQAKKKDLLVASDAAYIRAGRFADQVMDISGDHILRVKCESLTHEGDTTRSILIKFDIADLDPVGYAPLFVKMTSVHDNVLFNIYQIDANSWCGETVTHATAPRGELIFKNVKLGFASPMDMAPIINRAREEGAEQIALRIEACVVTVTESAMSYAEGQKPFIRLCEASSSKSYVENLVDDAEKNAAIWAWAEKMFDEWYERYQNLPPVKENVRMIEPDKSQYTKITFSSNSSINYDTQRRENRSRPLYAITDLDAYVSDEIKNAEKDAYGGIMVESMKQVFAMQITEVNPPLAAASEPVCKSSL